MIARAALLLVALLCLPAVAAPLSDDDVARLNRALLFAAEPERRSAIDALVARGAPDVAATLILAMRYRRNGMDDTVAAFRALTGSDASTWFEAMLWQEARPEIRPHPSYAGIKLNLLMAIDPEFRRFLGANRSAPGAMRIRLEEIVWGGVAVDGIPSLDHPAMIPAAEADYLLPADLVFGVDIAGDARAYPLRIMGWHEMANDTVGGVPVALAYCTLCGAGILYETALPGRDRPLVFGSSGLLYRSNKLMFDRETDSLWNQLTGEPVTGPLAASGLVLPVRPVAITSWQRWRARHPATTALSLETGFRRDYGPEAAYREYFASPDLMFPALAGDAPKAYVFGVRAPGGARAWPLDLFRGGAVLNERVGLLDVVLIGDAATRTVRAYERGNRRFRSGPRGDAVVGPGGAWVITESGLVGPDGTRLPRVPGHVSYRFAWDGFFGNAPGE